MTWTGLNTDCKGTPSSDLAWRGPEGAYQPGLSQARKQSCWPAGYDPRRNHLCRLSIGTAARLTSSNAIPHPLYHTITPETPPPLLTGELISAPDMAALFAFKKVLGPIHPASIEPTTLRTEVKLVHFAPHFTETRAQTLRMVSPLLKRMTQGSHSPR